jgi:hypothetical protein
MARDPIRERDAGNAAPPAFAGRRRAAHWPGRPAVFVTHDAGEPGRGPTSLNPRRLEPATAAAIFVAALAYFASFRPWNHPVVLDAATWDYMAVEMPKGLVPYRDVFLHKTPLGALIGAAGAAAGLALGVEPVKAAHAIFLVLGALGPVLLYLLCRTRLGRGASIAAAVALLAYDEWVITTIEGCLPKVPTVVFGLASMLAAERGAAFSSSIFGGLSVLCWQPGLAFLAGSWTTILARGERRPSRLAAIAAASLLPSVLLLGWLAAHGALGDFLDQAVLFNLAYIHDKARTPLGTLRALARTLGEWNDVDVLLAPAALAGLFLARGPRLGAGASPGDGRLPLSLVVSGAIYAAMTFVSYQSWPDAILLGPPVAAGLGAGLHALLASRLAPTRAAAATVLVLAIATIPDSKPKFHPPVDFETQRARFRALERGLAPDDVVIGVSVPEFFLHTGRRNGWKWPYLWFGVDRFAADHHEGGFDGILADLDEQRPAMMLVARMWAGPERQRFEEWAAARYDVTTVRLFPHLKRPLRVYRLRR